MDEDNKTTDAPVEEASGETQADVAGANVGEGEAVAPEGSVPPENTEAASV